MQLESLNTRWALNDGHSIPALGLGVYLSPSGQMTYETVLKALELGYRHIDTAAIYGNEADVGRAVRESGIPRAEIYVTSKLWNSDQGYDSALRAFDKSLKLTGLDYLDLYLIHWPVPARRQDSWRALVELQAQGGTRSIGVSNFLIRHLDDLQRHSDVMPAINQVELNPFLSHDDLRVYCRDKNILLEAYSPLTKGIRLNHPALQPIAKAHGKTPAQILIRWALEAGCVTIPKSNRPERLRENAEVFDFQLTPSELNILGGLNENLSTGWDPETVQ